MDDEDRMRMAVDRATNNETFVSYCSVTGDKNIRNKEMNIWDSGVVASAKRPARAFERCVTHKGIQTKAIRPSRYRIHLQINGVAWVGQWGLGVVDGGGELCGRETPITPVAQLIPPTRWAQGPTKLPKLPKDPLRSVPPTALLFFY